MDGHTAKPEPGVGYVFDREWTVFAPDGREIAVVNSDDGGETAKFLRDCLDARAGDLDAAARVADACNRGAAAAWASDRRKPPVTSEFGNGLAGR